MLNFLCKNSIKRTYFFSPKNTFTNIPFDPCNSPETVIPLLLMNELRSEGPSNFH